MVCVHLPPDHTRMVQSPEPDSRSPLGSCSRHSTAASCPSSTCMAHTACSGALRNGPTRQRAHRRALPVASPLASTRAGAWYLHTLPAAPHADGLVQAGRHNVPLGGHQHRRHLRHPQVQGGGGGQRAPRRPRAIQPPRQLAASHGTRTAPHPTYPCCAAPVAPRALLCSPACLVLVPLQALQRRRSGQVPDHHSRVARAADHAAGGAALQQPRR